MPLPKDDRIAFSLQIVSAEGNIKGLETAKNQLQVEISKIQKLDNANKNLFDPVNILVNQYQTELQNLNGIVRTTFSESNIVDSAYKRIQNYFFPNDVNVAIPSLSSVYNVWTKVKPFALTYAIGKTYTETYAGSVTKEADVINPILTLITSASAYTDIQNTTGQHCVETGTCSLPQYTTQATCVGGGGVWTPGPDSIETYTPVHTLKNNLISAVNTLKTFLLSEVTTIVTNDKDIANQVLNNAAISNINNNILVAINTWLRYLDFNTSHGQTTCVGFNSYNASLLAPTKLHSAQLSALQTALNNRLSFVTTRTGQLNTILGSISQNLSTGELSGGSGLYKKRYDFLTLRLNALGGSLTQLTGLQTATNAQDSIKANIISTKDTYFSILPTSMFKSAGNGTATVHLVDASFLSPGDTVFIYAEGQQELLRAVKSVNGNTVELNDIVPVKYRTIDKARLYKDIS